MIARFPFSRTRALPSILCLWAFLGLVSGTAIDGQESGTSTPSSNADEAGSVESIAASLPEPLRLLVEEVLERNPRVALMQRRADAASARPDQAGALPDPMASLNLFVLSPETRVGPQRLLASVAQSFPWFGKLGLKRQAAMLLAEAARTEVDAVRLEILTETRRLFYELAFQEKLKRIVVEERQILNRSEEAARARYSSGSGLQQEVVRIQAQLTRIETRILDIDQRSATLRSSLNALRDRASDAPLPAVDTPAPKEPRLSLEGLRQVALARRPELVAADATIAARDTAVELAKKGSLPDFTFGLGYTVVDRRSDPAGRASPPPDNGNDILALTGSVNVPIHRRRLDAALEENLQLRSLAEESKRQLWSGIERSIGDQVSRIPLLYQQWKLFDEVLIVQAEEALRSAEGAYATGRLNAVDLLDAEVVLFEVEKSIARTRADLAVAIAELEGAVASPLSLVVP